MMTTALLAVALSLASANDYVFVRPSTTNIVGVGTGETLDYRIPRQEDHEFLREAYAERTWINEYLSAAAESSPVPGSSRSGPQTGYDTNSIPHRYKWGDIKLYYYSDIFNTAFGIPSNSFCNCAVNYSSPTISEMTFVASNQFYGSAHEAIPAVFDPAGEPIADRRLAEFFDARGDVMTLEPVAWPMTNAYHDIDANDAITLTQRMKQKAESTTGAMWTRRYYNWPSEIDRDGNILWMDDENGNNFYTNAEEFAENDLTLAETVDVYKRGFTFFHDRVSFGGSDGSEAYVYEYKASPIGPMTITLPADIGGGEILELKAFALVRINTYAISNRVYVYNRQKALAVPVRSSTPYMATNGTRRVCAVDVTVDPASLYRDAQSMTGEYVTPPDVLLGWLDDPPRPDRCEYDGYRVIGGDRYRAQSYIALSIRWIIGIAKIRFHARTVRSQ